MFDRQEKFVYEMCARCGMLRQQPVLTESQVKRYYPSRNYYSYKENQQEGLFDRIRKYLLKHYYAPTVITRLITTVIPNVPAIPKFVKGGKVLDVGCGAGDTLVSLKTLGWNVYGLEIDRSAVAVAKKRGLANVSCGSFRDMQKLPDHFFDAIRLYHVIEHLNDPELCLSLIRKKLKSGGELLIGTPNPVSVVARVFGSYWYNLDVPRHAYLFTPRALVKMLTRHGFLTPTIEFCSVGGILGSLGYVVSERLHRNISFLAKQWLVVLVYPVEWILDKLSLGDVFVIRAQKI